jgi:hypothetical protein
MTRNLLMAIVGLLALVVSPFYGCDDTPTFHYGAAEMRAAVEGTWRIDVPATADAEAQQITISIVQGSAEARHSAPSGPVRTAAACTQNTFVRSAGACLDSSSMPLDVGLIAGMTASSPPSGDFRVEGTRFEAGWLFLTIGDLQVRATVKPTGEVSESTAHRGLHQGAVTLTRIAR